MTNKDYDPEAPYAKAMQSQVLGVKTIHPSPTNPRKTFNADKAEEMKASVLKHGVLQPIIVRPWPPHYDPPAGVDMPLYELVAGERRWRAASDAGLELIPGMVKHLGDEEVLEIQILENLQRDNLNALEEAEGFETLLKFGGYTAELLAMKLNKSRGYVYGRLKLLALGPAGRQAYRDGELEKSVALMVARIPPQLQEKALKEVIDGGHGYSGHPMSAKVAAEFLQRNYMLDLKTAPFPGETLELVHGHCRDCEKRTGNQPDLYRDVRSADVCTDPTCYVEKKEMHLQELIAQAKQAGQVVLSEKEAKKVAPWGLSSSLNGVVKLDEKCYHVAAENGQYQTYREVLKDTPIPTRLIPHPESGRLVEIVDEAEAKKAVNRLLRKDVVEQPSHVAQEKAREKAAAAEALYRRALFAEISTSAKALLGKPARYPGSPNLDEMRLITRQFWTRIYHDSQKRIARAWTEGLDQAFADDHARIHHVTGMVEELPFAELTRLCIECALVGMTDVPGYANDITTPSQLLDAARRYHVDPAAIRASVEAKKLKSGTKTPPENLPLPIEAAQAAGEEAAAQDGEATEPTTAAQADGAETGEAVIEAADAARDEGLKSSRASPAGGTKKQHQASQKGLSEAQSSLDGMAA